MNFYILSARDRLSSESAVYIPSCSLPDIDGLFHLALHPVLFSVKDFWIVHGNTVIGGITVVSYTSRFILFTVLLEPNAERSLSLPNVGVVGVVVTCDVVDGATQFFLGGFVFVV